MLLLDPNTDLVDLFTPKASHSRKMNIDNDDLVLGGDLPQEIGPAAMHIGRMARIEHDFTTLVGNVTEVRELVEQGRLNPQHATTYFGQSLLHIACEKNSTEVVQYLSTEWTGDFPTLLAAIDRNGNTPLHTACEQNRLEIVRYLIEECGADVTTCGLRGFERTPLHSACQNNHLDIVKYLVQHGASVEGLNVLEARDRGGRTPLRFAFERSRLVVITYLMAQHNGGNGFDTKVLESTDREGHTFLHVACFSNSIHIVRYLVNDCGANIEAQDRKKMRPLHVALDRIHRFKMPTNSMEWGIVRYLVEHAGVDVNAKDEQGWTPLHRIGREGHFVEQIRYFVQNGAEVEARDNHGNTPLHLASRWDHQHIVRHLVESEHVVVDARDNNGHTSLHFACSEGRMEVLKFLLHHEADVNAENKFQYRPLHSASNNGQFEIAEYIVESHGAQIEAEDKRGYTALHLTCMGNGDRLQLAEYLVDKGVPLDSQDKDNKTALFHVSSRGNLEIARLLISRGANRLLCDKSGSTPLHVTRMTDIAQLLVEGSVGNEGPTAIAYNVLTATNQKGETAIQIAERKLESGLQVRSSEYALAYYILSHAKRQIAVPPVDPESRKRKRSESSTEMNPKLSDFQRPFAERRSNMLGRSGLREVKYVILGFLSPIDVMNE